MSVVNTSAIDPERLYTLEELLGFKPPPLPAEFEPFWMQRFARAKSVTPDPVLVKSSFPAAHFDVFDLTFSTTDDLRLGGWWVIPRNQRIRRALVVGHGYGGREAPDLRLQLQETAFLFPCFRGMSRSRSPEIPEESSRHVLCGIESPDSYVIAGCVEDLWCSINALETLCPDIPGRIGFMGISFSGGLGALAIPWDRRISRAHLNVPSFGNMPLRLELPTFGSAAALQIYEKDHPDLIDTLRFFDAASAASLTTIPVHVAAALADPIVAPPSQFSIFNAIRTDKRLFVFEKGHMDYPNALNQESELLEQLREFFLKL